MRSQSYLMCKIYAENSHRIDRCIVCVLSLLSDLSINCNQVTNENYETSKNLDCRPNYVTKHDKQPSMAAYKRIIIWLINSQLNTGSVGRNGKDWLPTDRRFSSNIVIGKIPSIFIGLSNVVINLTTILSTKLYRSALPRGRAFTVGLLYEKHISILDENAETACFLCYKTRLCN